jgi:hypothetical protein
MILEQELMSKELNLRALCKLGYGNKFTAIEYLRHRRDYKGTVDAIEYLISKADNLLKTKTIVEIGVPGTLSKN